MLMNEESYGTHEGYETLEQWIEKADELMEEYLSANFGTDFANATEDQREVAFIFACES